jgi:hypothetical protein
MVKAERQVHTQPALTLDRDTLNRTTRPATSWSGLNCTLLERGATLYGRTSKLQSPINN